MFLVCNFRSFAPHQTKCNCLLCAFHASPYKALVTNDDEVKPTTLVVVTKDKGGKIFSHESLKNLKFIHYGYIIFELMF